MSGESCALGALYNIGGCIYKRAHILVIYMEFDCCDILISHKQEVCGSFLKANV